MLAKPFAAALAAALVLAPAAASASDTDAARAAIAAAKAKLDLNEQTGGLDAAAADAQARARLALEKAAKQLDKGRESRALALAQEAGSLADLAAASRERQQAVSEARANEAALAPR